MGRRVQGQILFQQAKFPERSGNILCQLALAHPTVKEIKFTFLIFLSPLFFFFEYFERNLLPFNRFTQCTLGQNFSQGRPTFFDYLTALSLDYSHSNLLFCFFFNVDFFFQIFRISETPLKSDDLESFLNWSKQDQRKRILRSYPFHPCSFHLNLIFYHSPHKD